MPSQTFTFTGASEDFVVPANVYTVTFDGRGGSGGDGGQGTAVGGNGGRVVCDVPVTPGETLRVFVGGRGDDGDSGGATVSGGFNGGGDGIGTGAGGGGWSDLRRTPYAVADDSLCGAPGGGGAANSATGNSGGGYGGTPAGRNGFTGNGSTANRGSHGTGAARGAPGVTQGDHVGTSGGPGQGGDGGAGAGSGSTARGGAGGGAGYAGGGGGEGGNGSGNTGGGGGGGCGLSTGINETLTDDENTGDGEVTLTWTVEPDPAFDGQAIYDGSYTEFTIPEDVTAVTVDLYGGEGGAPAETFTGLLATSGGMADAAAPGKGGRVRCDVPVTPGEVLRIYVGGRGHPGSPLGTAGFNGGGDGPLGGGGGGGATDVRRSPYGLADRLAIAPGGGGSGGGNMDSPFSLGGDGGTPTGFDGADGGIAGTDGEKGLGATSSAGGAGGAGSGTAPSGAAGSAGALGLGGDGGATPSGQARSGGGGGAGYYGGGGGGGGTAAAGGSGGGGGGGGGLGTAINETDESGAWQSHGYATLTWTTFIIEPPVIVPPTAEELLDLVFGVRGSTFRYLLLDAANQPVGYIDMDVTQGFPSITNDTTRTIKRTMDGLVLPPATQAQINPLVHRIQPVMTLSNGDTFPLGVFLFADLTGAVHSFGDIGNGSMVDQGLILDQPSDTSTGFTPGTLLADALSRVFQRAGLALWTIDPAITGVIGAPVAWPAGVHWSVIATDLCNLAGAYTPYFDNEGVITVKVVHDLATATPDLEYWTDDRSRIYDSTTTVSSDILDAPNRYIVIDGSASESPIVAKYDIPASAPHSEQQRGFYVATVIDADGLESVAAARRLAQAQYNAGGGAAFQHVQFSTPPDPRHDTFQVVAYDGITYLEQDWSMNLGEGTDMIHHLRRSYVPDLPGTDLP